MSHKIAGTLLQSGSTIGENPMAHLEANALSLGRFRFENNAAAATVAASKFTLVKNLFGGSATLSPTVVPVNPDFVDNAYDDEGLNKWDAGRFDAATFTRMRVLNSLLDFEATHSLVFIATPKVNAGSHTWAGKYIGAADRYQIEDPQPTTKQIGISRGSARSALSYTPGLTQVFAFVCNFEDDVIKSAADFKRGPVVAMAGTGATGTAFTIGARSATGAAPATVDIFEYFELQFDVLADANELFWQDICTLGFYNYGCESLR